jgi:TonB family protein
MESGSIVLSYVAGAAVRTLALAAVAWAAMLVCRVKSPAARHAVWTVVVAGMLSLAAATALLPPWKVRVLRAPAPASVALPAAKAPFTVPYRLPQPPSIPWNQAAGAICSAIYTAGLLVFAARLAYGYLLTRALVRASRRVPPCGVERILESDLIHVPLTVGFLRPEILLPCGWHSWGAEKLEAVLVHERNHVRRRDWAISLLAGINRCVFWFHPLAWWLERQIAVLAERACDDASLAQVSSRECYAETLLAMAAAVGSGQGRVAWRAMAMAKRAEVGVRVERILDESRQIWPPMTRARWFALAACGLPLVYLASVVRPARVHAQTVEAAPRAAAATAALADQAAPVRELQDTDQQAIGRKLEEMRAAQEMLLKALEQQAALERLAQPPVGAPPLPWRIAEQQFEIERMREQLARDHPQVRRAEAALAALQDQLREAERQAEQKQGEPADLAQALRALEQLREQLLANRARFTLAAPVLISRRDPEYTAEARQARKQGSVELYVTIGADGVVSDAQVTRSLDDGLDQKAIECVKQWRFRPAARDGEPVTAFASVEVKFRLD